MLYTIKCEYTDLYTYIANSTQHTCTHAGETLHRGKVKWSNLCISYIGLVPELQKMNTKYGKTLNRDSTVLYKLHLKSYCVAVMRFEILVAVTVKITVFGNVVPCDLLCTYHRLEEPGASSSRIESRLSMERAQLNLLFCLEEGGSRFVRNVVGTYLIRHTRPHPRRQ